MIKKGQWEIFFEILFWIAVITVFLTENRPVEIIAGVYALGMISFYLLKMKKEGRLKLKKD